MDGEEWLVQFHLFRSHQQSNYSVQTYSVRFVKKKAKPILAYYTEHGVLCHPGQPHRRHLLTHTA